VTANDAARYRLELVERSLASARENVERGNWRDAALFARAAVEHAAKAVHACFAAVPRSHDPDEVLAAALGDARFPPSLRPIAQVLSEQARDMGRKEHILLSYGDEQKFVSPWTIATEERARHHLQLAEAMADLARTCIATLYPPTSQ
jgi:HEPN domain-containing protein